MKYLMLLLIAPFLAFSQNQPTSPVGRGVSPIANTPQIRSGPTAAKNTYAVVVGISDYANDRIPDLRFAHVDAQAFADFLRSPSGGMVPSDHLMLLTNAQATAGKIIAAISWLIEACGSGDRAILYFSGHGDVEQVTKFQRGYLLAHDAPGTTYMAGGSLPVGFISDVVTTLSDAGVEVVMISDACRSGKLAGSSNGGTQATSAALAQQFSKEIKILSCQPEEFSLEGEQWGGGRGCFSFHLVDALSGLADANADGSVTLLEASRYLEEKVTAETAPHPQIPMTVGNKSTALAAVLPEALAALQQRKTGQAPTLSPIDAKGFEDIALAKSDTSVQRLYAAFSAALGRGELMSPAGFSANDYYLKLLPQPGIEKLKGLMTRNLAAALQDEAQVVINQLLRTDPQILDDVFSPVSKYDHLPAYLQRAGELLGEGHYMYRFIKAREYYFRSKALRTETRPDLSPDSLQKIKLTCLDTALTYDGEASYVFFEKGLVGYSGMRALADVDFAKAMSLSPHWILPIYWQGATKWYEDPTFVSSNALYKKVLELDSTFLPAYRAIGANTFGKERKYWFGEYVRRMAEYEDKHAGRIPITYYNYMGNSLHFLGRDEEAKAVLLKAVQRSNGQFGRLYANLGAVYTSLGDHEAAEKAALKTIELMPMNSEGYSQLAVDRLYFLKRDLRTVPKLLRTAIQLGSADLYEDLVWFFQTQQMADSALLAAQEWLTIVPTDPVAIYRVGQAYRQFGKKQAAAVLFGKLLSNDRDGYGEIPAFFYRLLARIQIEPEDQVAVAIESERSKYGDYPKFCFWVSSAYATSSSPAKSLLWLEKALIAGWKPDNSEVLYATLNSPDLDSIRDTKQFKKLVKKYLPEQARIMKIK